MVFMGTFHAFHASMEQENRNSIPHKSMESMEYKTMESMETIEYKTMENHGKHGKHGNLQK